jgi:L-fuconolactonase
MAEPVGLVDAQVHAGTSKYQLLERYLPELETAGVRQAVLVQHMGNADNDYLKSCLRRYPGRFAGVAGLRSDLSGSAELIRRIARTGSFSGVRVPARIARIADEAPSVWQALQEHRLVATIQGQFAEVTDPAFLSVPERFPGVDFVIEHVGCFRYGQDPHFGSLLTLAAQPNVAIMWSCLYQYSSEPYPHRDSWPYLLRTLDAFGPRRIVWSADLNRRDQGLSDEPDDYQRALDLFVELIAGLPADDRKAILGGNAARLYRIGPPGRPELA